MEAYFSIKPYIVSLLILGSFGYFAYRIRRLVRVVLSVKGKVPTIAAEAPNRLKLFITEILLQAKVRRKQLPGLMHMCIFFGFIVLLPYTTESMLEGVFQGFSFGKLLPGLYSGYVVLADVLGLAVLVALVYGFYRRLLVKPKYLTNAFDAKFVLLLILVIVLSFFVTNAFQGSLQAGTAVDFRKFRPISSLISNMFGLDGLSHDHLIAGIEALFWMHLMAVLAFLVYIPSSKHLHILAAIPNVLFATPTKPRVIYRTDLENEERFGIGTVSDLNWRNVLNLYACTECGRCEEQCPADATGKPLSPKVLVGDLKHELFHEAREILALDREDGNALIQPLIGKDSPVQDDTIWSCTSCRACENICPVGIQHLDLVFEIRKNLVLEEARFSGKASSVFRNVEVSRNLYGFEQRLREAWTSGLRINIVPSGGNPEYLFYVGCLGSYNTVNMRTAASLVDIFSAGGLDFGVLGSGELCCGDPVRRLGNEYLFQELATRNIDIFERYGFKKIVTMCPHCFNIFKNEYPQLGAKWEVYHYTEVLEQLVQKNLLKFEGSLENRIAFHDSCYLGRYNDIYASPRTVLRSIPGVELVELPKSRDKGFCCGGGGGGFWIEELGERISHNRMRQAAEAQIDSLVTACPFCLSMLEDASTQIDEGSHIQIRDLADIVQEVLE